MAPSYFLRTEHLGFRTWRPDDIELAVALWGDPEVVRYIQKGGPAPRAKIEDRLAREIAAQAHLGLQYWPMFQLSDDAHVGCCGLRPYRPTEGMYELGVHIRPSFWRRGFALESAREVIRHAFGPLAARSLFAGHHPENLASRGMLLKLGFHYSHDELYPPTGLRHPSYLLHRGT